MHFPTRTFRNANHESVQLLAAAGTLGMGAFRQRTSSLGDFHHHPVEVLAFRRAMSPDAWLAIHRRNSR